MDGPVVADGAVSLSNEDEDEDYTGDNLLAQALFKVGASELFLCQNYISVTMFNPNAWEHFMDDVKNAIETQLLPPGEKPPEKEKKDSVLNHIERNEFPHLPDEEKKAIIDSLMDEIIRPALANDGGGLQSRRQRGAHKVSGRMRKLPQFHRRHPCGYSEGSPGIPGPQH